MTIPIGKGQSIVVLLERDAPDVLRDRLQYWLGKSYRRAAIEVSMGQDNEPAILVFREGLEHDVEDEHVMIHGWIEALRKQA